MSVEPSRKSALLRQNGSRTLLRSSEVPKFRASRLQGFKRRYELQDFKTSRLQAQIRASRLQGTDTSFKTSRLQGTDTSFKTSRLQDFKAQIRASRLQGFKAQIRASRLPGFKAQIRASRLQGFKAQIRASRLQDFKASSADMSFKTSRLQGTDTSFKTSRLQDFKAQIRASRLQDFKTSRHRYELQDFKASRHRYELQDFKASRHRYELQDFKTSRLQGTDTSFKTSRLEAVCGTSLPELSLFRHISLKKENLLKSSNFNNFSGDLHLFVSFSRGEYGLFHFGKCFRCGKGSIYGFLIFDSWNNGFQSKKFSGWLWMKTLAAQGFSPSFLGWKLWDEALGPFSKKSDPTGVTERTPQPENLIARSQLTERGPLGFGPIQFLMDRFFAKLFFPNNKGQTHRSWIMIRNMFFFCKKNRHVTHLKTGWKHNTENIPWNRSTKL